MFLVAEDFGSWMFENWAHDFHNLEQAVHQYDQWDGMGEGTGNRAST